MRRMPGPPNCRRERGAGWRTPTSSSSWRATARKRSTAYRQAFLELDVEPQPASFEALRPAPSSTVVDLAPETMWLDRLRVASVLSHTQLARATVDTQLLHLQRPVPWPVEPLGDRIPDLVVLPASMSPAMFPGGEWQQIWRNQDIAVYEREVEAEP